MQAIPGAEYSPIPAGAWCWRVNGLGQMHRERAPASAPDCPGPHLELYRDVQRPWVVDLLDADTALLVLRRMLQLRQAPVRAAALGLVALSGRWSASQALQLGELCRRCWGSESLTVVSYSTKSANGRKA